MTEIKMYAEEQYVEHVQGKFMPVDDICLVCGDKLRVAWTDYNGEARCHTCGMIYQIWGSHLKTEFLSAHGLTKEDIAQKYTHDFMEIPLYRAYWEDTRKVLPLGTYIRQPSGFREQQIAYACWLWNHADEWRETYDEWYDWGVIERIATKRENARESR